MGSTIWLALQALGTMAIVIVVAYVSWRQTRRMLARGRPRQPSALARATPDPRFLPDPEVTDPFHVTDAHHEPASGDRADAGRPSAAGGPRERERMADRAQAASVAHPSAVERLDGMVGPADGARGAEGGADEAVRRRGERRPWRPTERALGRSASIPGWTSPRDRGAVIGAGRPDAGDRPVPQAACLRRSSTPSTVSPKAAGWGTMVWPAPRMISTFSCADSPKAEMMAPAWPIRLPLGAESPAT